MSAKTGLVVAVAVIMVLAAGIALGYGYSQTMALEEKAAASANLTANTIAYAGQNISLSSGELTFLGSVDGSNNQLNGSFTGDNIVLYIMNFSQVLQNNLYTATSTPGGVTAVNISSLVYMQAISPGEQFIVQFSNTNLSSSNGAYFFAYTDLSGGATMTISTNWQFSSSDYLVYGTGETRIG